MLLLLYAFKCLRASNRKFYYQIVVVVVDDVRWKIVLIIIVICIRWMVKFYWFLLLLLPGCCLLVVQFIFGFWCINIFIRVERRERFINCNITMANCSFTNSLCFSSPLFFSLSLAWHQEFFYGNQTSRKYERENSLAWKLTQFGHNNKRANVDMRGNYNMDIETWATQQRERAWVVSERSVRKLTATITVIGIHYLDENLSDRKRARCRVRE